MDFCEPSIAPSKNKCSFSNKNTSHGICLYLFHFIFNLVGFFSNDVLGVKTKGQHHILESKFMGKRLFQIKSKYVGTCPVPGQ